MSLQNEKGKSNKRPNYNIKKIIIIKGKESEKKNKPESPWCTPETNETL